MISIFDPMTWLSAEEYRSVTEFITAAILNGLLTRVFSAAFLVMGCWFVFRRKQTAAGLAFILLSVLVMFGGSFFELLGRLYV